MCFSEAGWEGGRLSPPLWVKRAAETPFEDQDPAACFTHSGARYCVIGLSNDSLATILTARLDTVGLFQRENINIYSRRLGGWQCSVNMEDGIKYLDKFRKSLQCFPPPPSIMIFFLYTFLNPREFFPRKYSFGKKEIQAHSGPKISNHSLIALFY